MYSNVADYLWYSTVSRNILSQFCQSMNNTEIEYIYEVVDCTTSSYIKLKSYLTNLHILYIFDLDYSCQTNTVFV